MTTATATTPVSTSDSSIAGARNWFAENRLVRQREGRLLGGVWGGFAKRYGVNPLVMRLLGLMSMLVLTPLIYIGLWVLMPREA